MLAKIIIILIMRKKIITAVFNSEGRSGKQERYLTIVCNSALTQQVMCKIKGVVE